MSTIDQDASEAWSALRELWPELDWTGPDHKHGAFHHVAVLGTTAVVRVSFAADHAARIARQSSVLNAVNKVGLTLRIPRLIGTTTTAAWSAMACTVVRGTHRDDASWPDVRQHFAGILESLSTARVTEVELSPVRAWCGGTSWPEIVDRITTDWDSGQRAAARHIVEEVVSMEESANPSLVHGDFGGHNLLWDDNGNPGLIDFDNACVADPAMDVAPLVGAYGAAKVRGITDTDTLERAKTYRASLPLQVAAAAHLGQDHELQAHALRNFTHRLQHGTLHDPAAA